MRPKAEPGAAREAYGCDFSAAAERFALRSPARRRRRKSMASWWRNGSAAFLLLLALVTASAPCPAQPVDLTSYLERYGELWAAGDYSAALKEAENFAAAAKVRYGVRHESYAGALFLQAK